MLPSFANDRFLLKKKEIWLQMHDPKSYPAAIGGFPSGGAMNLTMEDGAVIW